MVEITPTIRNRVIRIVREYLSAWEKIRHVDRMKDVIRVVRKHKRAVL